jgi:hypothetical protein
MFSHRLNLGITSNRSDEMLLLFSLIPATTLLVVGFFVLFTSNRAEGALRLFGQFLASWLLFLAGVLVLGGLLASIVGWNPISGLMDRMGEHMRTMEQLEQKQPREPQRN